MRPGVHVPTPYLAKDLENLQLAQSADTLYIVNQRYPVMKLTRTGTPAVPGNPVFTLAYPAWQMAGAAATVYNPFSPSYS